MDLSVLGFTPSKYQSNIYDFLLNDNGNAVVNAVAGSGKTTTIEGCAKLIPVEKSVAFFAFSAEIVKELKKRLPENTFPNVNVQTLHSVGFSAIVKTRKGVKLNNFKINSIINPLLKDWQEDMEYGRRVKKLIDLIRQNLIPFGDETKLRTLALKHEVEIYNGECHRAFSILHMVNQIKNEIDFTDMLYLPCTDSSIKLPTYDFVFIDECQDLNIAQQFILSKVVKPEIGRFIAVGDPKQAIFGFAGADVESFNKLKKFPNTKELPLSVNYRCGKNIVALAKPLVPQLEAFEGAIEGEVKMDASINEITDGDFVLCRNTAPLVQLCLEFLSKNKKAYIKGGDIGKSLINLIKKSKAFTIPDLFKWLNDEKQRLFAKLQAQYPQLDSTDIEDLTIFRLFNEKVTVIDVMSEAQGIKTPEDIVKKIEAIFKDDDLQGVMFSTIHRSKGLEANNVYVIERNLMPSKHAKIPWQKEQEANLEYVCYTRAKRKLGFIIDWNFRKKKK